MNFLELNKAAADTKVVVAMSGGVDSSTTAAILVEQGYNVSGVTLKLYDAAVTATTGTCCTGKDIADAATVCRKLGIEHRILNLEETFKRDVIDVFADTYLAGETPIPCILCNETVKFRDLMGLVENIGADILVTGHYARIKMDTDGFHMLRAVDTIRDQSYFLFSTTKGQLKKLRFPLGTMRKKETRHLAARFGLTVASKPDSQDICFVPKGSYHKIIKKLRKGIVQSGNIVDLDGKIRGIHNGLIHYTIGQRRGLGIGGLDEPLYVIHLDTTENQVVVGPKTALLCNNFMLRDLNWIGKEDVIPPSFFAQVKVRSTQNPMPATIESFGSNAVVRLSEPHAGIAPGQACVFYDGDRVLGGGWIAPRPEPLAS